jgi:hypothetical protein
MGEEKAGCVNDKKDQASTPTEAHRPPSKYEDAAAIGKNQMGKSALAL